MINGCKCPATAVLPDIQFASGRLYTASEIYSPDRENEGENVTELKITIVPYLQKVWFILLIIISR